MLRRTSTILTTGESYRAGPICRSLFSDLTSGLLFFGGPVDIMMAVLDIIAPRGRLLHSSCRDTGLALIMGLAMIWLRLVAAVRSDTVDSFEQTISVFAIAFVVIFQPGTAPGPGNVGTQQFFRAVNGSGSDDTETAPVPSII